MNMIFFALNTLNFCIEKSNLRNIQFFQETKYDILRKVKNQAKFKSLLRKITRSSQWKKKLNKKPGILIYRPYISYN